MSNGRPDRRFVHDKVVSISIDPQKPFASTVTLGLTTGFSFAKPVLYLSLYFKTHRERYYELLQTVRETGDWEAWLRFFLKGVEETAHQAGQTAKSLMKLAAENERLIQTIGKATGSALRVHRLLQAKPIVSIIDAATKLSLSVPTVTSSLGHLVKLGIASETTGRNYGRIFAYDKYLTILNEGTELPLKN